MAERQQDQELEEEPVQQGESEDNPQAPAEESEEREPREDQPSSPGKQPGCGCS